MIDDALSRTVIGCAMDVHRELGPGYLEKVYENALAIALSDAGVGAAQQVGVPAKFRGRVVGDFVADLLVERSLIVELKAVSNLLPIHEAQLVSYLKSTGIDVGLLINFGAGSLQVKRKYREYRPSATSQDRIAGLSGFTGPSSAPASAPRDGISGFSGFTGPVSAPASAPRDGISGFSGFTGPVSATGSVPQDRITGFSGFTGPVSAPASSPANPANPVILSKTPEHGGAGAPKNNPANPVILSKNGAWQ